MATLTPTSCTNGRYWSWFTDDFISRPTKHNLHIQGIVNKVRSIDWCHNGCDDVLNHRHLDGLLNGLFRRRSNKISKLRVTGLFEGNSLVNDEFPSLMASKAGNVSIQWRHQVTFLFRFLPMVLGFWGLVLWSTACVQTTTCGRRFCNKASDWLVTVYARKLPPINSRFNTELCL